MTEAVQIALIHAVEMIIPSAISAWAAIASVRAARSAKEAKDAAGEVKHAMNSLLDKRVDEAHSLGNAEGKAIGIQEERNRT
jgi:hypothetical protein